jgi:hypothetical protein
MLDDCANGGSKAEGIGNIENNEASLLIRIDYYQRENMP